VPPPATGREISHRWIPRRRSPLLCYLGGASPCRLYFPNLPGPSSVRREINPIAVSRPGGNIIFEWSSSETARRASFSTDDEDIAMAFNTSVEGNGFTVRRPTRIAHVSPVQGCQLYRIRAVATAGLNFSTAGSVGRKGDPITIRGEAGTTVIARRRN